MPKKLIEVDPIIRYFVQLRLQHRETQEEVAHKLGVPLTTYQRFEQGRRDPRLSEIRALCDYYDVTLLDVAWSELNKRTINDQDMVAAMKLVPSHLRQPFIELIKAIGS